MVAPQPPRLQFIPLKTTYEGNPLGFIVEASDPDGTIPVLSAQPLPEGASFTDQRNGRGLFSWTPSVGQAGRYTLQVSASDGSLSQQQEATIIVNPITDIDGDGLLDSWEREHFGDLSRDGSGDADGDGRLDRDEEKQGTDPLALELATIITPVNGETLTDSRVNFTWSDIGASGYRLDIGTSQGASNLLRGFNVGTTELTVSDLPKDGRAVYLRLWTVYGDKEGYNDYVYTALLIGQAKAEMLVPVNDATLGSTTVEFSWSNAGVDEYQLDIGSQLGAKDIFQQSLTDTRITINDLPADSRKLYVRLWSIVDGEQGYETYNDYVYTAHQAIVETATIVSPQDKSTLSGEAVTFAWDDVQADEYYLEIGTQVGGKELFSGSAGKNTQQQVTELPTNGSQIYLRLWTINGENETYKDYTYTTYKVEVGQASIQSPQPGESLTSTTVEFTWSHVGAEEYILHIGSGVGASDLFNGSIGTATQKTVDNLPYDGRQIYVRLWSKIEGSWYFNDLTYTAYRDDTITATMLSPQNGSTFNSRTVDFVWQDAEADQYYLRIGTEVGQSDLFYGSMGTATQKTITNLPFDGRPVYVRLYTRDYGQWRYKDTVYTAYNDNIAIAAMLAPQNTSTFSSTTVDFRWQDVGADQYFLRIGTEVGQSDLFYGSMGTATQKTVTNLPFDGRTIYVRLYTKSYGQWRYKDTVYAAGQPSENQ